MKKSVHLICERLLDGTSKNMRHIDGTNNFLSGYWNISEAEAEAIIGGWLYLHETKLSPSYRGGKILDFKREIRDDVVRKNRIGLVVQLSIKAIGQMSRGHSHERAWFSGLIEADFSHEH